MTAGINKAARAAAGNVMIVGSLNMDLVVRAPRLPLPGETLAGRSFAQAAGGKGGNQAVAAARLGARVAMLGCVGADGHGAALRAGLVAEGIDCTALAVSEKAATGVALIVVDDTSQNAIVIVAGSNGEVTPEETVRAALAAGRRLGKAVVLNPAPAVGPLPGDWLPLVDYLIPNEVEAAMLTGLPVRDPAGAEAAARALQAAGARNVIVTLGGQGVLVLTAHGAASHYPAPRVVPVDTTAAGDTFIGGFAARIAAGDALPEAIRFAQRAAALSVTRAGAQPSIPTLAELDAFVPAVV